MKKKVVLTMLALQLVLIGTVGCSNNDTPTEASITTEASSDSNAGSEQLQISGFDFDRAISNITIDGKDMHLPTTLNELGDEYTVEDIKDLMGNGTYTGSLVKKGNEIASVALMYNDKTDVRDAVICELAFVKTGIEYGYFSIDGVEAGDNITTVKEMYGEPTKFRMDTRPVILGDSYQYVCEEGKGILYSTNEKGEIINIYVSCKEK